MLKLTHDGATYVVEDGELTFGRAATVVVGPTNQFIHRIVGRLVRKNGLWWLENRADHLPIVVRSDNGSRAELPSRHGEGAPAILALAWPTFTITFEAGGLTYSLDGEVSEPVALPGSSFEAELSDDSETVVAIKLTDDERAMLTAMARPVLAAAHPGPDAIPSNKLLARELGWPDTKLNRKLDYLCHRLTRHGFQGLKGDLGAEARLRRWRLVSYAISHGLVDRDGLVERR